MDRERYFRRIIPKRQPRRSLIWTVVMLVAVVMLIVYLQRILG